MKYQTLQHALKIAACLSAYLMTTAVFSNPVLNNASPGVTVTQTPTTTTINQTSGRAILNWNSFNIGAQEHTHFQQPAGGMALNRISPTQGASAIYGKLTATGRIILINPAGIFFGPNSYVNVGSLIATTGNLTDENFRKGIYQFDQVPGYHGSIINAGQIIAAQHGLIALVGNNVENHGLIEADMGQIALASGNAFTMSFSGDNLISFAVTQGSNGGVTNTGALQAAGGKVLVTAKAAQGVLDNVINMGGVVEAKSVGVRNGEIILSGDPNFGSVKVSGKILATGNGAGEKGGTIAITGKKILVDNGTTIDASGKRGGGKIYVGGNYQGKGPLANAKQTQVNKSAMLLADATLDGDGGDIIVWSDDFSAVGGHLSARGGSQGGNGGLIETSSHDVLAIDKDIKVSTNAPMGTKGRWLLDPSDLTISNTTPDSGVNVSGPFMTADPDVTNSNLYVGTVTAALADNNVIVSTTAGGTGSGQGNITVATPITWNTSQTLTLQAINKIFINADIKAPLGGLILNANNIAQSITSGTKLAPSATGVTANINVRDFNLQQGQWYQSNATLPQFNITGKFQIDSGTMPTSFAQFTRVTGGGGVNGNPYKIADIYGLQGIGANSTTLSAWYQLVNDIDATGTRYWYDQNGQGFVPIGHPSSTRFTGNFDGNSKVINNLYINRLFDLRDIGLFGAVQGGNVHDVVMNHANITGPSSAQSNGILIGWGSNITATNNMVLNSSITAATGQIGGMFGNISGTVTKAFSDNVTIKGAGGFNIGGLIGVGSGLTLSQGYATGNITVTDGNGPNVGGLIGRIISPSTVDNSYSTVNITNTGAFNGSIGGLIGLNQGTLTNTYASGKITNSDGSMQTGGLLGLNGAGGGINNSFWDINTTGLASSSGSSGLAGYKGMTTAQMTNTANFTTPANGFVTASPAPWNISNVATSTANPTSATWLNFSNTTRPMLQTEWNTTIRTPHQLQLTGMALDANYTLGNNVDLTSVQTVSDIWASGPTGSGYIPVGTAAVPFIGSLNGNNNIITNLYINSPSVTTDIGLFGALNTAVISNVGVSGNISTGGNNVGMLAGRTDSSTITSAYSTGNITGVNTIGGLVGLNNLNSTINTSYASVEISGNFSSIGGLVGSNSNSSHINNSYATGNVFAGFSGGSVGGFVGSMLNSSTITNSYSTGHSSNGGFIGASSGSTISGGYWDMTSSGNATSPAGGAGLITADMKQSGKFTGWNIGTDNVNNVWVIFNGYTRPMLSMEVNPAVNGFRPINNAHQLQLISLNNTTRSASYVLNSDINASGTTSKTDVWGTTTVGSAPSGFVPIGDGSNYFTGTVDGNNHTVSNVYMYRTATDGSADFFAPFGATQNATIKNINFNQANITGNQAVGGLVGYAQNGTNIANASVTNTTVTGAGATSAYIGGLAGYTLTAAISNSSTSGTVTNLGGQTGGLVGQNDSGSIADSKSSATVNGGGFYTGGLVGFHGGYIYRSFSTGKVTGSQNMTGGLVGSNAFNIYDSYSTSNVSGTGYVGGLVGYNTSNIFSSYSLGAVSGTSNVGGLVGGDGGGDVVASYWDTATSGRTTSAGGIAGCFTGIGCPAGTANLSDSSTYTLNDWDFTNVWNIVPGKSYPYLRSFYPNQPRAISISSPASANTTANLVVEGTKVDSVLTFANGTAYFLEDYNTIGDGDYLLAYLSTPPVKANVIAVAPIAGDSIADLSFVNNTVQAGQDSTVSVLSNANLGTALGSYTDGANILYSVSGNDLTINPNYAFKTTSPTHYDLEGNVTTTNQNINFGGEVNLAALAVSISAGSGDVSFGSTLDGFSDLTINSNGQTSFSDLVGSINPLLSLTMNNAAGSTLFAGGELKTYNNQTYKGKLTTIGDATFTSLGGNLDFQDTIDIDNAAGGGYNLNFNAVNGGISFGGRIGVLGDWFPNQITAIAYSISMKAPGGDSSFNPTIFSLGDQTYTGSVRLFEDTVLNSITGSVNFNSDGIDDGSHHISTVDSMDTFNPKALTIYYGAENYFSENVGQNAALASLTSMPNASTMSTHFENTFDSGKLIEVHTIGNQIYGADVHVTNPVSLISTGGDIIVQQTDLGGGTFIGGNIIGNNNALTISTAGIDSFVEKAISNLSSFTKDGIGVLALFGTNTYSGTTEIKGGVIDLASGASLNSGTHIILSDFNSTALSINNNDVTVAGLSGGGLNGGNIFLGSGGQLTVNESGSEIFGGLILGDGNFVKAGNGSLSLTNQYSSYTGRTIIQAGELHVHTLSDFGFNSSIGQGTNGVSILIRGSGKFVYDGSGSDISNRSFSIGTGGGTIRSTTSSLTLNGDLNLNNNEVIFDTSGGNIDYAGLIYDNGIGDSGNLTKIGADTLRLSNTDNTYTGVTTIQNGVVEVTKLADFDNTSSLGATPAGFIELGSATHSATLSYIGTSNVATNRGVDLMGNGTLRATNGIWTQAGDIFLNGYSMTFDTVGGNIDVSGRLLGSGNLIKTGFDGLRLSGANNYNGTTTIQNGVLQSGINDALNTSSNLQIDSGAFFDLNGFDQHLETFSGQGTIINANDGALSALTLNDTADVVFDGTITGFLDFNKIGSNNLTLNSTNTYTGTTTISAGKVIAGADNVLGNTHLKLDGTFDLNNHNQHSLDFEGSASGTGIITNTGASLKTFTVESFGETDYYGAISGKINLYKTGSGRLTLHGASKTYTGSTTLNGGTLSLDATSASNILPTTTDLIFISSSQAPVLDMNSNDQMVASLNGDGGIITNGGGIHKLTINNVNPSDFAGVIQGEIKLIKLGGGSLTLSGNNTYSGATDINAGSIILAGPDALPDTTAVSLNGANTKLQLGVFDETIGSLFSNVASSQVQLNASSLTTGGDGTSTIFNGTITGTGNLVKEGSGNFTLGNTNSYIGNTIINDGTLTASAANIIPDNSTVIINSSSAIYDLAGFSDTIAGLSSTQIGSTVSLGAGNLTVGSNNATSTYNGLITGSGSLIKIGSGTLTLGGLGSNSFDGGVTINDGILAVNKNSALGSGLVTLDGGTLEALINFNPANDFLVQSDSTITGAKIIKLDGAINLNAGQLTIANSATTTLSGAISGNGSLRLTDGLLTMSHANNIYAGGTILDGGILQLNATTGALGFGDLTLNTGTLRSGALHASLDNNYTVNGTVSLINVDLNGDGTLNHDLTVNNTETTTLGGTVNGNGGIIKSGSGMLVLAGNNTYSGKTIVNGGVLSISSENNLGLPSSFANDQLTLNGGTLLADGSFTMNNANRGISFGSSGGTIEVDTGNVLILNNIATGLGGLTKTGDGTLTIGVANTYQGDTGINAGTVIANNNNALSGGDVNVASGGTLQVNNNITLGNKLTLNGAGVAGSKGALVGSGNATVTGAITLGSDSAIGTILSGDSLTLGGTIDDVIANTHTLTLQGIGRINIQNQVGNTGILGALTANTNVTLGNNIFGIDITTDGAQNYNNPVLLAGNVGIFTNDSAINFANIDSIGTTPYDLFIRVNGNSSAAISLGTVGDTHALGALNVWTGGLTTLTGAVTAASIVTDQGGTTQINGGAITTTGGQTFNDAVLLGAGTTLDSGGGNIKFSDILDGAFDLTIKAGAGSVDFVKDVGVQVAALNQLTVNSTGTTTFRGGVKASTLTTDAFGSTHINGGSVTTASLQTYNDDVVLGANTALTSGGTLKFSEFLDGGFDLTITAISADVNFVKAIGSTTALGKLDIHSIGTTTFGGAVTAESLSNNFGGGTLINGGLVTTTGTQNYGDDVLLGANTTLNSNNGDIKFTQFLNGAFDLTINAGSGAVNLGNIGFVTPLHKLDITSSGITTFSDAVIAGSLVTHGFGSTHLNGGAITTTGTQTFNNDVLLGAITTLASNGGAIKFAELVDGPYDLSINAGAGAVDFDKAVGSTGTLNQLNITSSGVTTFSGLVKADNLVTDATGSTHINGGSVTTTGTQTYNDDVVLGANTTLASGGNTIKFSELLDGPFNLTINNAGDVNFVKAIGGGTALHQLAVDSAGVITFGRAVNAGSLSADALGGIHINGGAITTTGTQTFNNDVLLGANTTLGSGGGAIKFAELVNGPFNLIINAGAGAVDFDKAVGSTGTLNQLNITSSGVTTFSGLVKASSLITDGLGSTNINGGGVTTSGAQTYNDNVVLGANTTLDSGNNNLKFSKLLNGGFNLNIFAGDVNFDQAIGGTTALKQLTINSSGVTTFTGAVRADSLVTDFGGSTHINGGGINTNGVQTFNDDVVLGANTTLASGGNTIKFSELLDGPFDLTINNAGDVNFVKAIGGGTALHQLAVDSTGVTTFGGAVNAGSLSADALVGININGGAITTTGAQTFNNDVLLGANTALVSGGGAVKFAELVNGPFNLTINAGAGAVDFDKAVGGGSTLNQLNVTSSGVTTFSGLVKVGSLTTDGLGSTRINGGGVTTTSGAQTYNDNVVLGANTTLDSGNNTLKFSKLLNGGFNLNIFAGDVNFDQAIGGTTALKQLTINSSGVTTFTGAVTADSLVTDATGSTHINGGGINTNGVQTFNDDVVLGATTTLASGGGAIKFAELVDGPFNLSINAGGGAVDFVKAVGSTNALNQLNVTSNGDTTFSGLVKAGSLTTNGLGSTNINGGGVTTSGVQTYNDNVVLGANTTLTSNGGAVKFSELLDGPFDLTINAGAGAVNFDKAIGSSNALTKLSSTGSGTVTFSGAVGSSTRRLGSIDITGNTNINGGSVYTSDTQTYGNNISLGSNATLDTGNSNAANLLLSSISGNGFGLILNNAGNTAMNGAVNGVSTLTTNALGTTTVGANVTSTGLQTYNDAVVLTGTRTFTSSSNDIIMQGTLDGGGFGVSFNNNGVNSAVNGVISNLTSLTKAGVGTLALTKANTYSGNTHINAGRLNISNSQAFGTSEVSVDNATLGIMGSLSPITNAMVLNNGQVVSSATNVLSGALNLSGNNIINATNNLSLNGLVSGNGGVNINGTGSVIFNNSNNNTGAVTLTSGQLIANNSTNPFGLGTLNLNGGSLSALQDTTLGNSNFVVNNNVSVGGNKAITINGNGQINGQFNQNNTASTKLSGSLLGTGTLAQNVGTLVLDADNTGFNGQLAFNGGTFSITNSNGLGDASLAINNGLVFDLNNVSFDNNLILNNGTLSITGNSTLLSDLTLGAGTNNTILIKDGASFSMNHDIKGAGSLLIDKGVGINPTTMVLNGNISNVTDITSNVDMTINGSSIQSTGNQRYNNPIVLAANIAFTSSQGAIRFANTINGNKNLNVQSQGAVTFDKAIGTTTALNALTAKGSAININGGNVKTVGDQSYQGPVTVSKTSRFETTGTNDATIAFNNGLQGNQVVTLAGGLSSNETFMLKGSINAQKISVEGGNGANKLQVDTGANQTFTVAANSQGSATLQGVGQFVFKNIQSLTGGSANDNFIIQNGTIDALNGAGGNNTITGKPGLNEVWNISGTNSGQSTSVNQFNNIQNLIGGNGDDTFVLAGNLTGSIIGSNGNDILTTVDGTNNWTLNTLNGGNVATLTGGIWQNKLGAGFTNIEALQGGAGNDTFTLAGGAASKGINGGSGNDALVANTNTSNNNWAITTANAGKWQGAPGSQQTFADVENLTGNNNNNFKFSDGATLAGKIDGGSLNYKNVIDVTAYKSPLTVKLATTNSGEIYDGNNEVTGFNNITDLNNSNKYSNTIYLPSSKGGTVWVSGINTGSINDPINFTGYQSIFGSGSSSADFANNNQVQLNSVNGNLTTVQVNGMPMYFYDFGHVNASFAINIDPIIPVIPDVSSIIQQPPTNADSTGPQSLQPGYVIMNQTLTQNMNNLMDQIAKQYDTDLSKIKINPYCYAANL